MQIMIKTGVLAFGEIQGKLLQTYMIKAFGRAQFGV